VIVARRLFTKHNLIPSSTMQIRFLNADGASNIEKVYIDEVVASGKI
jgi:hypothetical protein